MNNEHFSSPQYSPTDIADFITKKRAEKGLAKTELVKILNEKHDIAFSTKTLRKIESGTQINFNFKYLLAVLDVLGESLNSFVQYKQSKDPNQLNSVKIPEIIINTPIFKDHNNDFYELINVHFFSTTKVQTDTFTILGRKIDKDKKELTYKSFNIPINGIYTKILPEQDVIKNLKKLYIIAEH